MVLEELTSANSLKDLAAVALSQMIEVLFNVIFNQIKFLVILKKKGLLLRGLVGFLVDSAVWFCVGVDTFTQCSVEI